MNTGKPDQTVAKLAVCGFNPAAVSDRFYHGGDYRLFRMRGGWLTPHALTPKAITDSVFAARQISSGDSPLQSCQKCMRDRLFHRSNGQKAAISKAAIFQQGRVTVIGRFRSQAANHFAVDADHTPRGLGSFKLSDGEEWRTAMLNAGVPGKNARRLLRSTARHGTGQGHWKSDPLIKVYILAEISGIPQRR